VEPPGRVSPPFGERTFTAVKVGLLRVILVGVDQEEVLEVSVEHLAIAFTEYVPGEAQDFEALWVPTESHPEVVPSPQSKRYCTE
jgi:hypothetical protein